MTDKPKNDNRNLLHRNALMVSMGLNAILITMLLGFYATILTPQPPVASPPRAADPFELTATQLISMATEERKVELGIPTTPTVPFDFMPTLSPEDEVVLRNQYLNELETELGFLHPALEEIIDDLLASIARDINHHNYMRVVYDGHPDSVIQDLDSITVDGHNYIAVVIHSRIEGDNTSGFIFRVGANSAELLAQSNYHVVLEPFADRNGNGFPDVALTRTCDVSLCGGNLLFYEIRPNNDFVDLTARLNATINGFIDLDDDGIIELSGTQQLFIPEGISDDNKYPLIPRWFFWNGEEYEALPIIEGE
jgi:hypothetical protein